MTSGSEPAFSGFWRKLRVVAGSSSDMDGKKVSVGHAFALNLRTQGVRHLAAAEGEHEHDMSVMQRLEPKGLRQGVPRGKRVLVVYDRAGIDYAYWKRCRQEVAAYFPSRTK